MFKKLKQIWYGLFGAMKVTEMEVLKPKGVDEKTITTINQQVQDKRVSTALLAGKETQEVKELRYRTYRVDREAKEFEYYSPTLAMRRDKQDTKFIYYDDTDGLPVITIQNNFPQVQTVEKTLEQVGNRGEQTKYWINIEREFGFVPRYRIEEYTKRLVVKEKTPGKSAILEFYVTKYPDDKEVKSKGFVREVEHIMNESVRSDILDINLVSFISNHAYKVVDMLYYSFRILNFERVYEYDGHYVLRFLAEIIVNGRDMTDEYYNKEMAEKYENNAKKEVVHDLIVGGDVEYVCESCGKKIVYSEKDINEKEVTPDDVEGGDGGNVTEFFDLQIAESTFGKRLCKDCLKKYLEEIGVCVEK